MSRRDSRDDDAPEREQIYPREMPLPTYEEVVGIAAPHVGFKSEVLLGPTASGQHQQGDVETRSRGLSRQGSDTFYAPSTKSCRKGILFVIITMILVPIFALIIVLKSQACAPPSPQNLDSMYTTCMNKKRELQKQLDVIANPGNVKESIQEYQDKLKEKKILESSLQQLRQEYSTLSEQKAQLMTTATTTTIAPIVTTQRKKTQKEQLDELFDINKLGIHMSLDEMLKKARDIMNSRDE